MPTYDYKCKNCSTEFEVFHHMSERWNNCPNCENDNIVKLFNKINLKTDQTVHAHNQGYKGKYPELVKKLRDKNYREGYKREQVQQEAKGTQDFNAMRKMQQSQEIFQKMKAEGEKMTQKEKKEIKEKYGIKKGMKDIKLNME